MPNKEVLQKIIILAQFVLLATVLAVLLKVVVNSAGYSKPGQDLDPGDISEFHKTGSYKIDANTILNTISNNQTPKFLTETGLVADSETSAGPSWSQAEFMKVVNALFEFVWNESLDKSWSIHKMSFKADCSMSSTGFEYATFVYYQLIFVQGELRYNARALEISPHNGRVLWGGDSTFFRPVLGADLFDLDHINFSADDILGIAEENGGKLIRQSIQNSCDIHLYLNKDWEVDYVGDDGLPVFEIEIDPFTGKIIRSN